MSDPLYNEYFELLRGAREHLSTFYPKGSHILAEKENWEALRQAMTTSRQNEQVKPVTKAPTTPAPKISSPAISQISPPTPIKERPMPPAVVNDTPTPSEPKRTVDEKINRSLTLAELPAVQEVDFKSWKEVFVDKFPQIQLVDPSEECQNTQTSIVIVYEKVTPQELTFLQNIARTCHLLLGPTQLLPLADFQRTVESEPQKMVLCYGIHTKEGFPIEQLSDYLLTPALKAQLWRQLSSKYMQKSS